MHIFPPISINRLIKFAYLSTQRRRRPVYLPFQALIFLPLQSLLVLYRLIRHDRAPGLDESSMRCKSECQVDILHANFARIKIEIGSTGATHN